MARINLLVFRLSGNVGPDPQLSGSWHFKRRAGAGGYQLLSCLNGNQLRPQRHTQFSTSLSNPTPDTHIHTLATFDTMSCEYGRSEQTQITPATFLKDSSRPLTPLLSPFASPQGPLVHSQQHLQMTGCETHWKRTALRSSFSPTT